MPAGAAELGVPACDGDPAATGARPWQFPLRPYSPRQFPLRHYSGREERMKNS